MYSISDPICTQLKATLDLHVSNFTKSVLHEIYNFTATVNHSNKMVHGITLSHYFTAHRHSTYKQLIILYINKLYL